jgi:hypothetical protein
MTSPLRRKFYAWRIRGNMIMGHSHRRFNFFKVFEVMCALIIHKKIHFQGKTTEKAYAPQLLIGLLGQLPLGFTNGQCV